MSNLSRDKERRFVHQILKEVVHGFKVPDFEAAIGLKVSEACALMDRLERSNSIEVLSSKDATAARNATILTMQELGPEEFSTRVGFELSEAQAMVEHFALMQSGEKQWEL